MDSHKEKYTSFYGDRFLTILKDFDILDERDKKIPLP